jgi:ATP-dependent Zn protease
LIPFELNNNYTYEKSKILLESERAVIERIAKILLEKEVLEGDELRRLLKKRIRCQANQWRRDEKYLGKRRK